MKPFGIQGFSNADEAKASARAEISVTERMQFAVMRKGNNYGWLFPLDYAKRISASNDVEIVEVADLIPHAASNRGD